MWLSLSKFFLVLLILYTGYFQAVFFQIPNMLFILGFFTVLFLLIFMYQEAVPISDGFTIEIVLWIVFAVSSIFVGYIIVENKSHLFSSIFTLTENLILIVVICYISKKDGNINYILNIIILLALLCAITTIFFGKGYCGSRRISLTADTNPNGLGILLIAGMFGMLYKMKLNKRFNGALFFSGIIISLYVIILGGSRAAFISAILLFIYWHLFYFGWVLKRIDFKRKISTIVLIIFVIAFSAYHIISFFEGSVMLQRISILFERGGGVRREMYSEAYRFFLLNPLFGVGYKNYEMLSVYHTYSHSTYAEVLACTGLMGMVFYFCAYITIAIKIVRIINDKHLSSDILGKARIILGIFLVMIFMGTAVIHFYEFYSVLVFAMIISFGKLHYKFNRKLVLR